MHRIYLIHWNKTEAGERLAVLEAAGCTAAHEPFKGPSTIRRWREDPPDAFVIDLNRLPSHGRDVALAIRYYKGTRRVPLVFVEGDPEKVTRIKKLLPDAVYTAWSEIRKSLKQAIAHPPEDPVKPKSLLDGYSGTPLPKKLGIKADFVIALINAPQDFEKILGELPERVTLRRQARGPVDLAIWFTKSRKDLERGIERIKTLFKKGGLWIVCPKKASRMASDLTLSVVREVGLAAGLVDYKVCAIDDTWSGLKFTRRKSKRN